MKQRIPGFNDFVNEAVEFDKIKFIEDVWKECIKKAKPKYGEIPMPPKIVITNSRSAMGGYRVLKHGTYERNFDESELRISQWLFKMFSDEHCKYVIEHEFAHLVQWKESKTTYANMKPHSKDFYEIFKNIFGYDAKTNDPFKKISS